MFALVLEHGLGSLLLFAAACLGHTALWVYSHNRFYAYLFSSLPSKLIRLAHLGSLALFPFVLLLLPGFDPATPWTVSLPSPWPELLTGYLAVCWAAGLVLLPLNTLARHLRPRPAPLVSNHTETVDVARTLGHRPAGASKHGFLAHFPGNEIFTVDFVEKTFCFPRLPAAWEGLTILHLSDLHFIGSPDKAFYRHVLDRCAAWEPDLVAMTGDVVDSDLHRRWIVPLLGRLRWRIAAFAILGNHDWWWEPPLIRRRLGRLGFRVLGNGWEQLEVRGEPLVVIGQEGPWFTPEPDLKNCPEGPFRLCLSHTPDNLPWARRHGIDLMLSGHNHGGQIRLPVFGSVFVPSRYGRRYDCGIFHEPPTLLHVVRGLGAEHPIRYNCHPEVVKIVLRRGE